MICPICEKRKATRLCPARAQSICTVCCATEREVTIDCPSDCQYLVASRRYGEERNERDWANRPFPDVEIRPFWLEEHHGIIDAVALAICNYASDHRALVDNDVNVAVKSLAESYRTLASGLYYEDPPPHAEQRGLYQALKEAIATYRQQGARSPAVSMIRDSEIRDALIALAQIGYLHTNHRPKGRAFLDFLRRQYPQEFANPASNIVLLP